MILKTDRLILRPWAETDANSLYEYAKDLDVGPIAGWPPHKSVEESLEVIKNVLQGKECYAICEKDSDVAIGSIELKLKGRTDMTDRDDECEMGFWIGKPYWGRGYIPEAAAELLRRGFEDLGMTRIWCGYYDGNEKSKRAQEKIGFTYHHTCNDVPVSLMGEVRVGHTNVMTRESWLRKNIEIRKATVADAEGILECCKVIGGESDNLTFGSEGVSFTVEQEREYLDSVFHSDKNLYLVAAKGEEIVGTASFASYAKPRLAHRGEFSIAVKKAYWGNHIATDFLKEILAFAKDTAKAEIISLEVRSDNHRAIELYKKFGFEIIGTFDGFMKKDGNYISCEIMRLELQ